MELEMLLTLVVLALVDSLSIGTLLVPLFFLLSPAGVRVGRVLLYLATIGGFYFGIGLLVAGGAGWIVSGLEALGDSDPITWVQLVLGVALLGGALLFGKSAPKAGTPEAEAILHRPPGRLARWREQAMHGSAVAVLGVALGAGVLELATMLPYLGAIGMLTQAALPLPELAAVLAGYCAVMVAPAIVLLLGRVLLRGVVEPPLQRLARWLQLNGAENTAWIIGIVGFLLARDAAGRLALFEQLGIGLG